MSRKDKSRRNKTEQQRRKKYVLRRRRNDRRDETIASVQDLIEAGCLNEARAELESFNAETPGQTAILRLLLDVYHELRDYGPYCGICQELLAAEPGNLMRHLMLGDAYLNLGRPASALLAFRRFIAAAPDDSFADGARETIARIEAIVPEMLKGLGLPSENFIELVVLHEEVLANLALGDDLQVIRLARQLATRCPEFKPALNNLSESYFRTGQSAEAIATARQVLEQDPRNVHALANLSRFLFLCGRSAEARPILDRLRLAPDLAPDSWCKKAATFSYFGDDQAVLDIFDRADLAGCIKSETSADALFYHLAAVAAARQGEECRALRLWRLASATSPELSSARDNLEDVERAIGERNGPWPFRFDNWLNKPVKTELYQLINRLAKRLDDAAAKSALQQFAAEHPEVLSLAAPLLDRGDALSRQVVWQLAQAVQTDELHAALRDFCLSDRGPDELRTEIGMYLGARGLIPSGPTRFWIKGVRRNLELCGFEITNEPFEGVFAEKIEPLAYEANRALERGDGHTAERLIRECLEVEPDAPALLNNLAMAFQVQGRIEESLRLIHEIHERFPDYLFGRTALARLAIDQGDFERAHALLNPLRRRPRLHVTEFSALASTYVELFLSRHEFESARAWLAMWRPVMPDDPQIEDFDRRLFVAESKPRHKK